jgi:hypothetical protein
MLKYHKNKGFILKILQFFDFLVDKVKCNVKITIVVTFVEDYGAVIQKKRTD